MHNIKRNKKVLSYLTKECGRIDKDLSLKQLFEDYIFPLLGVSDTLEIQQQSEDIKPEILDNENVLIETLKFIGIMEASKDKKELDKLNKKRKDIKHPKGKSDFDVILKGIINAGDKK